MSLRAHNHPAIPLRALPSGGGVDLVYKPQKRSNWCWAACVEMVLKTFHIWNDTQCQIAEKGLKLAHPGQTFSCCANGNSQDGCNKTLKPRPITLLWKAYGITVDHQSVPTVGLPAPERMIDRFRQLLDDKKPLELGYSLPAKHVVLLYKWVGTLSHSRFNFLLYDPNPDHSSWSVHSSAIFDFGLGSLIHKWEIG